MRRPFVQVDVFTETAYFGNPVAVVLDSSGLGDEEMQRLARWTNLSETTFVLPPTDSDADYRVRIFTPVSELPFAGHPTLGTCHAWLEATGSAHKKDTIVQDCASGRVRIRSSEGMLAFAAPPLIRYGPVDGPVVDHVAEILGIDRDEIKDAYWLDNGPGWVGVLLRDAQAVLAIRPGRVDSMVGVAGAHPPGSDVAFEVRAFFPKDGVTVEDPVTGSLNASLAKWLFESGRVESPYVAAQGAMLGRRGRVHVELDPSGTIWVGGGTVTCLDGTVEL